MINELQQVEKLAHALDLALCRIIGATMAENEKEKEKPHANERGPNLDNLITGNLEFTKKEFQKMSNSIKKEFIHITKRKSGENGICYEIRYRKNGLNISASSTDFKKAKEKFLEKAKNTFLSIEEEKPKSIIFNNIALEWFSIKNEKWHETTRRNYEAYYKKYIAPKLGEMELEKIRTYNIFEITNKLENKGRTYEDVRSILNQIFNYAINNGIISHNPVKLIEFKKAERKHGNPLKIEEETKLIIELQKTEFKKIQQPILTVLFFGLRPVEIESAIIDGNFLKTINAKRKKGKIEYKRIPISIQAKTFLNLNKNFKIPCTLNNLNLWLKKILPNHTLYDLRHTFTTRCREYVSSELVAQWLGHSPQRLIENTYNHFTDEYQINEMAKVNYLYLLFPKSFPKRK